MLWRNAGLSGRRRASLGVLLLGLFRGQVDRRDWVPWVEHRIGHGLASPQGCCETPSSGLLVQPLSHMPAPGPVPAHAIEPVERSTVVDQVVDSVRAKILLGHLPIGSRLPAERDLARSLGVNRLTLRAALARLQALGLIVVRHGAGTVVANWRETAGLETLSFLLRTGNSKDPGWHAYLGDLLEVRRILAAEAVALACQRRTDADLAELRSVVDLARARTSDPVAFAELDIAISRAVVRSTHNLGFELLLNMVACLPVLQPELARAMYPDPAAHMAYHDAVVALVERAEPEAARLFVRTALERQDRSTFEQLMSSSRTRRLPRDRGSQRAGSRSKGR